MATINGNGFGNTLNANDGVTSGNDTIRGYGGSDTILGLGGDDLIWSGEGNFDYIDGGSGTDTAMYTDLDEGVIVDLEFGEFWQEQHGGTADRDRLISIENVTGSSYDDHLYGDYANNVLSGLDGDDILDGGNGVNILIGGPGADDLRGPGPGDRLGLHTASYVTAMSRVVASLVSGGTIGDAAGDTFSGISNLTGSSFDDTLTGNSWENTLDGGGDSDELQGGAGADTLIGGYGTDIAIYTDSGSGVTVNLASGLGFGGTAEGDTLREIENLAGSIYADDLSGDADPNHLRGFAGHDTLKGGGGADTLDGGRGIDTVRYGDSSSGVIVSLLGGIASGGTADNDTLIDIENLTGSPFADELYGDEEDNRLVGAGGDDWLKGGGGADTIDGGPGNDTATYLNYGSGVTVSLSTGTGSGGAAQGDVLIDIENLYGTVYADTLTGDADVNILDGDDGDDTLRGGGGADRLDGGSGSDTATYSISSAGVLVDLTAGTGSGGAAEGDTLTSIENLIGSLLEDELTGNADGNLLNGGLGADILVGHGGADLLVGGNGADTMAGGTAGDVFLWTVIEDAGTTVDTADTVSDFNFDEGDRIDLKALDANVYVAPNQAFTFIGTDAFTHDYATRDPSDVIPGEIRYYHADGDTFIELQTGTSPDIEGLIRIAGIHDLEAGWFVL